MVPDEEDTAVRIRAMMAGIIAKEVLANRIALEAYVEVNAEKFEETTALLTMIEKEGAEIEKVIVDTFAENSLELGDLRLYIAFLKITNELIRIADGSKKYAKRIRIHQQSACNLTPFNNAVIQLHKSVINALNYLEECVTQMPSCDVEAIYRKVMVEENKNDDLFAILEKEIMAIIVLENDLSAEYVKVLGTIRKLERLCDRALDIAELMQQGQSGTALLSASTYYGD